MSDEEIKDKIILLLEDNTLELDFNQRVEIELAIIDIVNSLDVTNSSINFLLIMLMIGTFISVINQAYIIGLIIGVIYGLLVYFKCGFIIKLINKLNIIIYKRLR